VTTKKSSNTSHSQKPSSTGGLSRFQNFTTERLHRTKVNKAPYNPRVIGTKERRRLKAILESPLALLQPLIWNRRTGNLVGGHQRLGILDQLEGSDDYELDFAVVDLDEGQEQDANMALNNQEAMGQFDPDALQTLLEQRKVSAGDFGAVLAASGFDMGTLSLILPSPEFFRAAEERDAGSSLLDEVEAMARDGEAEPKPDRSERTAREIADKKRAAESRADADDTETYTVLQFSSRGRKEEFLAEMGLDYDQRYVDGADVLELVRAGKR
jgi:hypothetical protein